MPPRGISATSAGSESCRTDEEAYRVSLARDLHDAPFLCHIHIFKWHCEYVTTDLNNVDRTNKFYRSRLGLFRKFDEMSLEVDEEMWYSITPESIAKSHARTITSALAGGAIVLDPFCGIGGDLVQLPSRIFGIGCDIQPERVKAARELHACTSFGAADFVVCDSMNAKSCFRSRAFDSVYLSPAWGHRGVRNRIRNPVFGHRKLESLAVDGKDVFQNALDLTKNCNIVFYLPRGMDMDQLGSLRDLAGHACAVSADIHASYDPDDETIAGDSRYRVRAITMYFGTLAKV